MPQNRLASEKQLEYWKNCYHRWNVKTGATRSGKTYMDYFLIPKRLLDGKGKTGMNVMLGNTRETVRRNVIFPMQEIYGVKRVSNIHSDNSCDMFGEKVFVLGADNVGHVDKIRGMSIKYCYGDEVTTWSSEIFDMLKSRLDKPYSVFDGTCNPDYPGHWFKKFLDSEADIYQQHYTIFDNPFLPKEFIDNLCTEYKGTVYYDRYILGNWTLAEGLIFPMYEKILEPCEDSPALDYRLSIDYGTMNAFATLLWEKHGDIWHATRRYYYSGRDERETKTDEEYARELDDLIRDIMEKREKDVKEGKREFFAKMKTIIDPSAASFIALLKKRKWYSVIPADNSVLDGIRETATCMSLGLIKVSPDIKEWRKEAEGYVWDDSSGEDRPVKVNDHLMDATRYFCKTMRLANKRR